MNIHYYKRTLKELKDNKTFSFRDPENILGNLTSEMSEAFLNKPAGYNDKEVAQIIALDDNEVIGASMYFNNFLRLHGKIVPCQGGSYLYSREEYRKHNIGADLFFMGCNLQKDVCFAGISQMALPLYKAMRFTTFFFPRMIYLKHSRSVIHSLLKTESVLTYPLIMIADLGLALHRLSLTVYSKVKYNQYVVEETNDIPDDVERIILEDKHPFAEYHDRNWLEWSLKYSFKSHPMYKKKLFIIKKNGKIVGFFIAKYEFFEQASSRGFKNVYLGSVMEWGIDNEETLTEADLYLLAIRTFPNEIDGIQVATSNENTKRLLKRCLFIQVGEANMSVKIRTMKDSRLKDINNWRIRIAASDTLMD